ncbi:hypothetical protein PRNP1_014386 [Phytophthora ramorum]
MASSVTNSPSKFGTARFVVDVADLEAAREMGCCAKVSKSSVKIHRGEAKGETGGLSGLPVRDLSTKVLGDMYKLTKGQIPLIGVGGESTGQDEIRAGASLVQMYSCLIYESPLAVPRAKNVDVLGRAAMEETVICLESNFKSELFIRASCRLSCFT